MVPPVPDEGLRCLRLSRSTATPTTCPAFAISASNADFGIFVQNTLDPDTIGDDTGNPTTVSRRRFVREARTPFVSLRAERGH